MASIPDGGSPPPESPHPGDPPGALVSRPAESQASRSTPGPPAVGSGPHHDWLRNRPLWKKILAPIVLAVISGLLFLAAIALYSSPGELSSPSYATLNITSTFSISAIYYRVSQASPSIAKISIILILAPGVRHPPANHPAPSFFLWAPPGIAFHNCPVHYCHRTSSTTVYWSAYMKFFTEGYRSGYLTGEASANVFVSAHNFGYTFNSVTAAAAIPQVVYNGPGTPTLQTKYDNAPLASSYDWSALPTQFVNSTSAFWDEPVTGGSSPGRVAVGINQANQAKNSNKTFFAGALIGLAGGALLAAAQEALHAND